MNSLDHLVFRSYRDLDIESTIVRRLSVLLFGLEGRGESGKKGVERNAFVVSVLNLCVIRVTVRGLSRVSATDLGSSEVENREGREGKRKNEGEVVSTYSSIVCSVLNG